MIPRNSTDECRIANAFFLFHGKFVEEIQLLYYGFLVVLVVTSIIQNIAWRL